MRRGYGSTDALRGFASLRTRPVRSMDPSLTPPKRYCRVCGAVLAHDNKSDHCSCHDGVVEIPDWAVYLAECDPTAFTVQTIAELVERRLDLAPRLTKERRRSEILQTIRSGVSQRETAKRFGVSRSLVQKLINSMA